MAVTCFRFVRSMRRMVMGEESFFWRAAAALEEALASFLAESFSRAVWAAMESVPILVRRASRWRWVSKDPKLRVSVVQCRTYHRNKTCRRAPHSRLSAILYIW